MTKKDKKELHKLYEKHYSKGKKKKSKAVREKEAVVEKVVTEQKAVAEKKGQSRADLMAQAREKGVKNFRVLNREELMKVLDSKATQEDIAQVVQGAVARWKSGWGSKGGRPAVQAA